MTCLLNSLQRLSQGSDGWGMFGMVGVWKISFLRKLQVWNLGLCPSLELPTLEFDKIAFASFFVNTQVCYTSWKWLQIIMKLLVMLLDTLGPVFFEWLKGKNQLEFQFGTYLKKTRLLNIKCCKSQILKLINWLKNIVSKMFWRINLLCTSNF